MAVKTKLQEMISQGIIDPQEVESISFFVDEHSTATNGWYELRESLEKEFKIGMWNYGPMTFHKPLFPSVKSINLQYCNSAKTTLVRAADIIANHIFISQIKIVVLLTTRINYIFSITHKPVKC